MVFFLCIKLSYLRTRDDIQRSLECFIHYFKTNLCIFGPQTQILFPLEDRLFIVKKLTTFFISGKAFSLRFIWVQWKWRTIWGKGPRRISFLAFKEIVNKNGLLPMSSMSSCHGLKSMVDGLVARNINSISVIVKKKPFTQ